MQVWKLWESLFPWRSWWLSHLPSSKTQALQVLKKDLLLSTTSRASPLRCHGSFYREILGRKTLSPFHRRDVKQGFYQDTEIPIWGSGRHAGAHWEGAPKESSIIGLTRKDGAKDYKTQVLHKLLRQEGISHEVTERYCPQSNGLVESLNLTVMVKVRCMLIDANLTPKLCPYAAHYAVIIYNNLPHFALDNRKSPNDAYGDSSYFSKLYVFNLRSF